jgi:hypothetical protein
MQTGCVLFLIKQSLGRAPDLPLSAIRAGDPPSHQRISHKTEDEKGNDEQEQDP